MESLCPDLSLNLTQKNEERVNLNINPWMYSWILIAFRSKIYSTDCDIAAQIKVLKYEKKAK